MPKIASINKARSDYKFTQYLQLEHQSLRRYRALPLYINHSLRKVALRDLARGSVVRAHLYVALTYKILLSKVQLQLFNSWNKQYPPNQMEIKWTNKIANLTGRSNGFISQSQQNIVP